jgi:hypothetical protein
MGESVNGETAMLELVAPFLSKPLVNELCSGRKWEDYRKRKLELLRWRIACAWWRQRRMAEEVRQKEYRFVDGLGQLKAIGDPVLVGLTRSKYRRLAFHDPDNLDFILKEHPEFRVPVPKPRYLMVNGLKGQRAKSEEQSVALRLPLGALPSGGARDGARGDPATAVDEAACRQTRMASVKSAGSAHEIPAPLLPSEGKEQRAKSKEQTGENLT